MNAERDGNGVPVPVADSEAVEREVDFGKILQLGSSRLGLNCFICPSADNVSADLLDYCEIDNKLVFYLADISGHDLPAAMVAKALGNWAENYLHSADSLLPDTLAQLFHAQLKKINSGHYATLIVGIFDPASWQLSYCIAGHRPVPLCITDEAVTELPGDGFPVGLYSDVQVKNYTRKLPADFLLLICSDGILEHIQTHYSLPGGNREELLQNIVARNGYYREIYHSLRLADAKQCTDDIALLVVKGSYEQDSQG